MRLLGPRRRLLLLKGSGVSPPTPAQKDLCAPGADISAHPIPLGANSALSGTTEGKEIIKRRFLGVCRHRELNRLAKGSYEPCTEICPAQEGESMGLPLSLAANCSSGTYTTQSKDFCSLGQKGPFFSVITLIFSTNPCQRFPLLQHYGFIGGKTKYFLQ